ncbi:tripartite motif-containing protein 16-like protein [Xyrichtys novacula]|uniref:Tripartite motif-containing protein 16-like protein n=1 Tax=Xyrichtys novacula TaxID=13765 RepID=A0AAV1H695_XYRNO|nr:tripartite motif-containing protein 16-like protein [Xyrichtys novacula]
MPARPNSAVILMETSKPGKKTRSSKKANQDQVPVYVPNIPEPTCRAELINYWMNLSFDDKTANKLLWISDGGSKVYRRTEEVCPVLDRPERYEYSPQVLCKEAIWNARAYWEAEYTGWVVIGATYEGAGRRANSGPSGLGENEESWGLCWSGTRYQIWFNGLNKDITSAPYSPTIGVYIDQPAGIINFYSVGPPSSTAFTPTEGALQELKEGPTDKHRVLHSEVRGRMHYATSLN